MSDEKIDVLAVMDDLIDFEERHAEAEPRANYEAREAREAVDEMVKAAQRVLEKDWEYGDDQPHFARLNAALARVRSS